MMVGEVAEAAGLTVRTLHHWDSTRPPSTAWSPGCG
jgi:DNA-binding transcriptional MerR regulator